MPESCRRFMYRLIRCYWRVDRLLTRLNWWDSGWSAWGGEYGKLPFVV
jgi:hypothetical protein